MATDYPAMATMAMVATVAVVATTVGSAKNVAVQESARITVQATTSNCIARGVAFASLVEVQDSYVISDFIIAALIAIKKSTMI